MEVGLDWGYLRAHPHNLDRLIEHQRIRTTPLPGGDTCRAERLTLDDGSSVFAKSLAGAEAAFFASEAAGLRWLGECGCVSVPEVVAVTESMLLLSWVESGAPTAAAADELGRSLAALHASGADAFGAPWPGWIGRLPLDNSPASSWPDFYAGQRVLPFVRQAVDAGRMAAADAVTVEQAMARIGSVGVPAEPPARLHGDLWSGNVLWSAAGPAYLVDTAAHGGHRETDLAMLALFGLPYLDRTIAAYDEAVRLGPGWRERVALHQLHPLAVHAAMFGGGYGARAAAAARRYL
ncbi:MAG: fructosamine kinase family protein [Geodermatophilaceae bacterium]|nr:fructosamine kinase family protein [Geodermatophilaceae bacterium]